MTQSDESPTGMSTTTVRSIAVSGARAPVGHEQQTQCRRSQLTLRQPVEHLVEEDEIPGDRERRVIREGPSRTNTVAGTENEASTTPTRREASWEVMAVTRTSIRIRTMPVSSRSTEPSTRVAQLRPSNGSATVPVRRQGLECGVASKGRAIEHMDHAARHLEIVEITEGRIAARASPCRTT